MSVVIPNEEMPKACYECDYRCGLNIIARKDQDGRHENCPLVELPQASTKSEDELIDAIIEQNGIQAQTIQLGEEMGELFTAVSHRLRNRTTSNEHIKEEVADVMFMLRQLIRFFDLDKQEVEEVIEQKKQRMRERIKNRKGE